MSFVKVKEFDDVRGPNVSVDESVESMDERDLKIDVIEDRKFILLGLILARLHVAFPSLNYPF